MAEPTPLLIDDLHVGGVLHGARTVPAGHRIRLLGRLTGDLIVAEGARVELFGVVEGDLHAFGRADIRDGACVSGRLLGDGIRDRRETPDALPEWLLRRHGHHWVL